MAFQDILVVYKIDDALKSVGKEDEIIFKYIILGLLIILLLVCNYVHFVSF